MKTDRHTDRWTDTQSNIHAGRQREGEEVYVRERERDRESEKQRK